MSPAGNGLPRRGVFAPEPERMTRNVWLRLERGARALMVEGMARGFVFYGMGFLLAHAWRERRRDRRARGRTVHQDLGGVVDLRSRRVRMSDATIDPPSSSMTTSSETNTGMCTNAPSAILTPTNSKTSASPG